MATLYKRITLKEFGEFIQSLPVEVQAKEIFYIDISHVTKEDLEDIKARLLRSKDDEIEMC